MCSTAADNHDDVQCRCTLSSSISPHHPDPQGIPSGPGRVPEASRAARCHGREWFRRSEEKEEKQALRNQENAAKKTHTVVVFTPVKTDESQNGGDTAGAAIVGDDAPARRLGLEWANGRGDTSSGLAPGGGRPGDPGTGPRGALGSDLEY